MVAKNLSGQAGTIPAASRPLFSLARVLPDFARIEIWNSRLALIATVIALCGFLLLQLSLIVEPLLHGQVLRTLRIALFSLLVSFLLFGNLVYFLARSGYWQRLIDHQPVPPHLLRRFFHAKAPALTIVVPSYREERLVIRKTLLSAALQQYPRLRVVLLIDDPSQPRTPEEAAILEDARSLVHDLNNRFARIAAMTDNFHKLFLEQRRTGSADAGKETEQLVWLFRKALRFYAELEAEAPPETHEDLFFVEHILKQPRRRLETLVAHIVVRSPLSLAQIGQQYCELSGMFSVEITAFERKQFVNLSHESNKAMNINSYLALLGDNWRREQRADGVHLVPAESVESAELVIPPADYVICLDADSILLPEYAASLTHFMEMPKNSKVAVVQAPYNAFPGAPGVLERTAAATTDIQHILHQGFTHLNATYWVGANALIRTRALGDIMDVAVERGFVVRKFIQDRTVIEDTESSIDLVWRGWQLHNYPERLAWSATPPDAGSLLIQRRRWANGGLIILPKLLRYLLLGTRDRSRLLEGLVRAQYLASITGVNLTILMLMFFPFRSDVSIAWVVLGSLPYILLYGRDLHYSGYPFRDLGNVYALNLMLIPVNLAGVLKSLEQILTDRATPFRRTPKVTGRTAMPPGYIVAEWSLALLCTAGAVFSFSQGNWAHGIFSVINAAGFWYAILVFIGVRSSLADVWR